MYIASFLRASFGLLVVYLIGVLVTDTEFGYLFVLGCFAVWVNGVGIFVLWRLLGRPRLGD